jgi:glycosyltransferase involved in cell wall biosynthesis
MEKRIAIFTQSLLSGGAEKQATLLAMALNTNHRVILIVFFKKDVDGRLLDIINKNNIKLIFTKGPLIFKPIHLYKLLKINNIQIIFSYLLLPNLIGGIVGRLSGVKHQIGGIRNAKIKTGKLCLNKFSQNIINSLTIYNNYKGFDRYSKNGFNSKRGIVIPNCIESIPAKIQRKDNKRILILSVGRFEKQKDYHTALRVIETLAKKGMPICYKIVGYGSLEGQIRKWIKDFNLSNVVELYIKPQNIDSFYREADIYLMTSLFEGLPNTILEAMSYSLPIVATDVGDNNKLVNHGENGYLLKPKMFIEIANKLEVLLKDHSLRLSQGKNGYNIVNQQYSFIKFKKRYLSLIKSFD